MDILSFFVIIPVLTVLGIVFCRDNKHVRIVSAIGMGIQLILAAVLIFSFLAERKAGNTSAFLYQVDHMWYKSLNIHYLVGVDGISVAMIGLTAIVVFAGIFASWEVDYLPKEFFISLILIV